MREGRRVRGEVRQVSGSEGGRGWTLQLVDVASRRERNVATRKLRALASTSRTTPLISSTLSTPENKQNKKQLMQIVRNALKRKRECDKLEVLVECFR